MAADGARESILGTLRSEFDDDDSNLHEDFETLAALVGSVRAAFTAFRLTPEQTATFCQELRLQGSDGNEWTVGATSGGWFRRKTGERRWTKTTMPLNVTPVYTERPAWLQEGIGGRLLEAEKQARHDTASSVAPAGENATLNPFQRKDTDTIDIPVVAPRDDAGGKSVLGGGDASWLLEEWAELDRPRKVTRAKLPAQLPEDLRADRQLSESLDPVQPPAARDGADVPAAAPVDRSGAVNPEDFFLRPEK